LVTPPGRRYRCFTTVNTPVAASSTLQHDKERLPFFSIFMAQTKYAKKNLENIISTKVTEKNLCDLCAELCVLCG